MSVSVQVKGLGKALLELRSLGEGDALREEVAQAIDRSAERVLEDAKRRVPVLTGLLQESLKKKHRKGSLVASVEADYPKIGRLRKRNTRKQKAGSRDYYAFAVEFGTKTRRAKPFLFPAAAANEEAGEKDVADAMERVLRRGGS